MAGVRPDHALSGGQFFLPGRFFLLGGRGLFPGGLGLNEPGRRGRGLLLGHGGELLPLQGQQPPVHPILQGLLGLFQGHAQSVPQGLGLQGLPGVAEQVQDHLQLLLARQFQVAVHQAAGHGEHLIPQSDIQPVCHFPFPSSR